MSKEKRAFSAQETLATMERGFYVAPDGQRVSVAAALKASCDGTVLYLLEEFDALWDAPPQEGGAFETTFAVNSGTTLEAWRRLSELERAKYERVACLNFASAKNPSGGFLGGAKAQEESLAQASGLYACLRTQPDFYSFHRALRTCLYSDRVIFSPDVPIFCDDDDRPLSELWKMSVLTCAAVNVGAVRRNEPGNVRFLRPAMARRARMVLAIAAVQELEALILGAWGCGVFQNDPAMIAEIFAEAFAEPRLRGVFRHVVFAVYERHGAGPSLQAFRAHFANPSDLRF